jgi:signal transduction histidine kinase
VYYQHSKDILIENQKEKMMLLFSSVRNNIEQTAAGEKFVEDLIGQNLRTASIAIQHQLNPDIDKVDNRELVQLSDLIGVDGITLFQKTSDDIVGTKSSDPKEINVSSKGWATYYPAFKQLFDLQEVRVGIGQTLPHFWSGPMDTSTTRQDHVDKWGYYYDGTTNYIIDPFVHDTKFRTYQSITGVDDAIRRLTEENRLIALEISVLNSNKLLNRNLSNPERSNWYSERLVYFGQYTLRDADEQKYAQIALDTDKTAFYLTSSNGKPIIKSFTPLHTDNLKYDSAGFVPLIEIASDYSEIQRTLRQQLQQTILFMLLCTSLCLLIMAVISVILRRNKERAVQDVQDTYVGNIETLFQSIKEQRHDFINHIQTIHSFLTLKHYDEVQKYTKALVGEIRIVNELIDIDNPALIALIQAKITQAERLNIRFDYAFDQMAQLKLSPVKSTDIVKMLSNLIDNAFDATMELDPEHRRVKVTGDVVSGQLQFQVYNTGHPIPPEIRGKLFEAGFTSKGNGKNSGLGLHIVKQLVNRYQGSIDLKSEEGYTQFTIRIPF